jgi:hypothetical protein
LPIENNDLSVPFVSRCFGVRSRGRLSRCFSSIVVATALRAALTWLRFAPSQA